MVIIEWLRTESISIRNLIGKYYVYIIITIVLLFIYLNSKQIYQTFSMPGIEGHKIIRDYLCIIISWPLAFVVVLVIFIMRFPGSIKIMLENIGSFKLGPFEVAQCQGASKVDMDERRKEEIEKEGKSISREQISNITKKSDPSSIEKDKTGDLIVNIAKYYIDRAEYFEFAYLSRYLVPNTKLALLWFNRTPSMRETFMSQYTLLPGTINCFDEKEAIFNALLSNGLIEINESQYRISEKGAKFLRFINYSIS